jgi:hypothetical protein
MDALREGMGVTILSDAVTGRRSEDGQACLAALRAALATCEFTVVCAGESTPLYELA